MVIYALILWNLKCLKFCILKYFKIDIMLRATPMIIILLWNPPPCSWLKCNIDGATKGTISMGLVGVYLRWSRCCFGLLFCLSWSSIIHAEIMRTIHTVDIAFDKDWHSLWSESDLILVVQAFQKDHIILWYLWSRWHNTKLKCKSMRFHVSRTYREGNHYSDKFACFGVKERGD